MRAIDGWCITPSVPKSPPGLSVERSRPHRATVCCVRPRAVRRFAVRLGAASGQDRRGLAPDGPNRQSAFAGRSLYTAGRQDIANAHWQRLVAPKLAEQRVVDRGNRRRISVSAGHPALHRVEAAFSSSARSLPCTPRRVIRDYACATGVLKDCSDHAQVRAATPPPPVTRPPRGRFTRSCSGAAFRAAISACIVSRSAVVRAEAGFLPIIGPTHASRSGSCPFP